MSVEAGNARKVLLVAAEVAPFAKAGGLADVAGALPRALKSLGVDVRIMMPAYRMIMDNPAYSVSDPIDSFYVVERPGIIRSAEVYETKLPSHDGSATDIPVYLLGETQKGKNDCAYFQHAVDSNSIYAMEADPYVFFDRAVAEWISRTAVQWCPDIVHSNDWHCGLIPVFSQLDHANSPGISDIAHLFTIHNLAYQGEFDRAQWYKVGLNDDMYTIDGLECFGRWSFLKGALNYADHVNTVSPNYAKEILTPEYGNGLDGLLHKLDVHGKLSGILNGIDTIAFDPATDPALPAHYSSDLPGGKSDCRAALQVELGLANDPDCAVIGVVSRFVEQKGLDLIYAEAERILTFPVQLVMLGIGDPRYERLLTDLANKHPGRVAVRIEYNANLAQRIYAGSDLFLMPSRFEPCGLGQLIALRYGTIPVVRATGGLVDTITDYTAYPQNGNGFVFAGYSGDEMVNAIRRGVAAVQDPVQRATLIQRAMLQDWSWHRSGRTYVDLYAQMAAKTNHSG